MLHRITQSSLLILLVFAGLLTAENVKAQCMHATSMGPAYSFMTTMKNVAWTLTGTPGCNLIGASGMTTNNAVCFAAFAVPAGSYNCPAGTMMCSGLLANIPLTMTASMASTAVPTNTGPHQCSWDCGPCGTYVLSNANGLPVELMEFSIPE